MKLLDTNVFIYAHGRPHAYKEPCRALVAQLAVASAEYVIDAELLQEIMHVYDVRGERAFGLTLVDVLLDIFRDPIPIGRAEVGAARHLMEEHLRLSSRDAIHAAVVQTNRLEGIVTTDQAFSEVRGLAAFDPRDLATGV
ncbi:MAG: type II toxin-antitoxin system VapC family toxin [Chloroflexi bacterium]|nr:type II toxin-antitoxin system VapC family toxin [Chloroflexota bacterium]